MKKTTLIWLWLGVLCVSTASVWGIVWIMDTFIFERGEHYRTWRGLLGVLYTAHILFLSIGATTMFLNFLEKVRSNKWLRFLSFFLVPLLMIAGEINSRSDIREEVYVLFPVFIPFMLCLSVAYILFIRSLKIDGQQTYCSQFRQKQNQFPVH